MRSHLKLALLASLLSSCASPSRILGAAEQERLGLHGVIYDAKLCPTELDPASGRHRIAGDCEWVNCEKEADGVVCRARPVEKD